MNIVDVIIVLMLLFGLAVGFQKGFTSQLVDTIGSLAVIVLSFLLKGIVSNFFYQYLPFFQFSGKLEGLTSLNLILYEVIAFFILFVFFVSILRIIKATTNVFERLLKMTIVLGIPSKILGALVGLVENFIFLFVTLYFLSLPVFRIDQIKTSKLTTKILNSTPVLSQICSDSVEMFQDFDSLLEEYKDIDDREKLNQETLQLLVDKNIVSRETVNDLIDKEKLTGVSKIKEEA